MNERLAKKKFHCRVDDHVALKQDTDIGGNILITGNMIKVCVKYGELAYLIDTIGLLL